MKGMANSESILYQPTKKLLQLSESSNYDVMDEKFAVYMDQEDPLRNLRGEFNYPLNKDLPAGKIIQY